MQAYASSSLRDAYDLRFVSTADESSLLRRQLRGLAAVGRAVALAVRERPGIFHVHMGLRMAFWRKAVVALAASACGHRTVLHVHAAAFDRWIDGGTPLRGWVIERVFAHSDAVIALSPEWRSVLLPLCDAGKITVLTNPVRKRPETRGPARENRLLFLGRLEPRKGVPELLAAIGALQREGVLPHVVLAGDGAVDETRQAARRLPRPDLVEVPGWLEWEGVAALLDRSSVFCLPSHDEGLPVALLEAMSGGLACVTTPVGGIPSVVTDGENGLFVTPGDVSGLTQALREVLTRPERARALGAAAAQAVQDEFSVEAVVRRLESLYTELGYPPSSRAPHAGDEPPVELTIGADAASRPGDERRGCPFSDTRVAVARLEPRYPSPEEPSDAVRGALRATLAALGLDAEHHGSEDWNPLGVLIEPGDTVVLKPNLLWHAHKYRPDQWQQVITHGSVVRAVLELTLTALGGRGRVVIADGPQLDANWGEILRRTGLQRLLQHSAGRQGVDVSIVDLRDSFNEMRGDVRYAQRDLAGDPRGGVIVDLGAVSRLSGHRGEGRYYGADYDQAETNLHHRLGRHEYRVSRTVLEADVIINIPKLKTHKKVGVTLSMKNLVGINTGRNWLPHHTDGDPSDGGDQFPTPAARGRLERAGVRSLQRLVMRRPRLAGLYRLAKKTAAPIWGDTRETVRSGNWSGNDTCWRMVHDINRALLYCDGERFSAAQSRRYLVVVDGVVGGEGNGPEAPDAFPAGIIASGFSPVAVDAASAYLMGFDPMKIPMLRAAFDESPLPLADFDYADIEVLTDDPDWAGRLIDIDPVTTLAMRPHFGWVGAIEHDVLRRDGQAEDVREAH